MEQLLPCDISLIHLHFQHVFTANCEPGLVLHARERKWNEIRDGALRSM